MNGSDIKRFVDDAWQQNVLPAITDYIRIPNKSPAFDPDWRAHGHMDRALDLLVGWCNAQDLPGARLEVLRVEGRTPLIYVDVPGDEGDCVLLYGHFDKQPEMTGWREGLDPWTPVLEGDKLYGRGGADDGYSTFASLTALRALRQAGQRHARCVVIIEGCEESGSYDLPAYLELLAPRIGTPSLIVCLDSGCGNYDQLWATTSLRGLAAGTLTVELLTEGVHSGDGSGVIADSFRVARQLISRLEDERTGEVLPREFHVEIPRERVEQAVKLAGILGDAVYTKFPLRPGAQPVTTDRPTLILNRTWRPALSVIGAGGLPSLESAGNVLRPSTSLKLSLRLPPACDPIRATETMSRILTADPPYGAKVTFEPDHQAAGWNAPPTAPWLRDSIDAASRAYFGREAAFMGEGGTIPFMAMLGEKYPQAQFLITGLLGPGANAHGPNEFLHIPTAKNLTACVAQIIADHYARE